MKEAYDIIDNFGSQEVEVRLVLAHKLFLTLSKTSGNFL